MIVPSYRGHSLFYAVLFQMLFCHSAILNKGSVVSRMYIWIDRGFLDSSQHRTRAVRRLGREGADVGVNSRQRTDGEKKNQGCV